jgi:uncharacterized LabA/DUF88 family protein
MAESANARLAVLIDTDNAQHSKLADILGEAAKYGTATVKRAYGNWTTQALSGWKGLLLKHAIQPMQQFSFTTGKNATDSALIIDAMDLLHAGVVGGFCLVSSDSDFTRLATRIREAGYAVYGFGEKKTPEAFVAACDKFIYTEILGKTPASAAQPKAVDSKLKKALMNAVQSAAQDDGAAFLGQVGAILNKNDPSFDPRIHGYKKLGDLVRAQPYLVVEERPSGVNQNVQLYVRINEA